MAYLEVRRPLVSSRRNLGWTAASEWRSEQEDGEEVRHALVYHEGSDKANNW